MAKYDYFCQVCDKTVEVERPMAESEPEDGHICPTCGYRMVKQYSLPAITFKGPGFYSTDNPRG